MWQPERLVGDLLKLQLDPANSNSVISIPRCFELKIIFLGFSLQLFTIGYFEPPLFRELKIPGFNCIY